MLSGRRLDLLDPSAARHRDRGHRARARARRALERADLRRAYLLGRAAHAAGRRDRAAARDASTARARLAILLHDAPEYVIGDMITPFKAVIGDAYKAVESRLLAAIHLRFGLPPVLPAELTRLIKSADRAAAYLEATRLAGFAEPEAQALLRHAAGGSGGARTGLSDAVVRQGRRSALSEAICRSWRRRPIARSFRRLPSRRGGRNP